MPSLWRCNGGRRPGSRRARAGWIITTARNGAIDRLRREAIARGAARPGRPAAGGPQSSAEDEESAVRDDRLRLILTCCHPALATDVKVAWTLRLLGGLTTAGDRARVPDAGGDMAQRLVRAKRRFGARIPYRIPSDSGPAGSLARRAGGRLSDFQRRLHGQLGRSAGPRRTLHEAIRLGRLLAPLMPRRTRGHRVCSRSCCSSSRAGRAARRPTAISCCSRPEPRLLGSRSDLRRAGRSSAAAWRATSPVRTRSRRRSTRSTATRPSHPPRTGGRSCSCTDQLLSMAPGPVVALNRAVAVAEVDGPAAALALVESRLEPRGPSPVPRHPRRPAPAPGPQGRSGVAYAAAIARTGNARERAFLLAAKDVV